MSCEQAVYHLKLWESPAMPGVLWENVDAAITNTTYSTRLTHGSLFFRVQSLIHEPH